jgi:hypothetical protein
MNETTGLPAVFPDSAAKTALVRALRYRRNDGGGSHYLRRVHMEEYHNPLYGLLRRARAPAVCLDIDANYGYTGL